MIGQTISHYKLTAKLGAGGMGEVYLATDTRLDRQVALKFLPESLQQDPEARQRLLREAKAASKLNHPNILTVFAVEEAEGRDFIAMEYVEGRSLKDLVTSGDLDICRIIETAIQIGEGLAAAHKADVVHRDIKSDNVVVTPEGRAKIMDFGLATWRGASQLTKEGSTVGTMAYMSPEQAQGQPVDQRTDLWSLGVILYEMVTRRLPFEGDHDAAITYSIVNEMPHPLARYSADVPEELQRIVSKCLNKNQDERYQSASDLVADLRALRRFSSGGAVPAAKPSRKRSRLTASLAVAGVAVVSVVVAYLSNLRRPEPEPTTTKPIMLAVLPFENLGDPENEYFADGITDEITSRLATIHGLGVTSRTSAYTYKKTEKTLPQVGRELGVDYILEGTIRWDRAGDTNMVRVTPQLIKVDGDVHLWSGRYDEALSSIFSVQSQIATKIVSMLNIQLAPAEQARLDVVPTQSMVAYSLYLRAINKGFVDPTSCSTSIALLQQAIEIDSSFAIAYADLSFRMSAYHNFAMYTAASDTIDHARNYAETAISLDPLSFTGYQALGHYYYWVKRDFEKAVRQFEKALEINPNTVDVLWSMALVSRRMGWWDAACDYFQKASELNPTRWDGDYLETLAMIGRHDDALELVTKWQLFHPDNRDLLARRAYIVGVIANDLDTMAAHMPPCVTEKPYDVCHVVLFELRYMQRNYEECMNIARAWLAGTSSIQGQALLYSILADLEQLEGTGGGTAQADTAIQLLTAFRSEEISDEKQVDVLAQLAKAHSQKGDSERAAALVDTVLYGDIWTEYPYRAWYAVMNCAEALISIGAHDRAIDLLEQLLDRPSMIFPLHLKYVPQYDPLRDHPRFQALLKKSHKVF